MFFMNFFSVQTMPSAGEKIVIDSSETFLGNALESQAQNIVHFSLVNYIIAVKSLLL